MRGFARVSVAVPVVGVADFDANLEHTLALIERAEAQGNSLVVFPELGLCGYTVRDLTKDILPKMRSDPGYLERSNMQVLTHSGDVVDPSSVDWSRYPGRPFPYVIRQDPGPKNALGLVKFIFPNPHFVFLHDTPQRHNFDRAERAFSSGCIRVDRPFELARLLLDDDKQWNDQTIRSVVDSGETRTVFLDDPLPVILLYWTVNVLREEGPYFFKDIYDRDARLLGRAGRPGPLPPACRGDGESLIGREPPCLEDPDPAASCFSCWERRFARAIPGPVRRKARRQRTRGPSAWSSVRNATPTQVEEWTGSHHDLAMQPAVPDTVLGDFDDAEFVHYGVETTFFRRDGEYLVRTDGPDGESTEYRVAYTFGVEPLQQYLIEYAGGRLQALSICWDTREAGGGRATLVPSLSGRADVGHDDPLHWTGALPELELHVLRVPLHRCAQGLRRGRGQLRHQLVRVERLLRGLPRPRVEPRGPDPGRHWRLRPRAPGSRSGPGRHRRWLLGAAPGRPSPPRVA